MRSTLEINFIALWNCKKVVCVHELSPSTVDCFLLQDSRRRTFRESHRRRLCADGTGVRLLYEADLRGDGVFAQPENCALRYESESVLSIKKISSSTQFFNENQT